MSMLIGEKCVVSIHYTLKDDEGRMLDTSMNTEPLVYLHGAGNLIPGLENELTGKAAKDSFSVTVAPGEAFGDYQEELVRTVPLDMFKGVDEIKPGMQFETRGPNGPEFIIVTEIKGDEAVVDGNHPHAGKNLNFEIDIESVREATSEELEHGHPHGEHGHSH